MNEAGTTLADAEPQTLSAIHDAHYEGVVRLARGMGLQPDDAQDVAQNVFATITAQKNQVPNTDVGSWVHTLARAAVAEHLRLPMNRLSSHMGDAVFDVPDHHSLPPEDVIASESVDVLNSGMQGLPQRYQTILNLRYLEGLDTEAIGAQMSIAPTGVHSCLSRARKALRLVTAGVVNN